VSVKVLPEDFTNKYDRILETGKQIAEYQLSGKSRKEAIEHFQNPITQ
jgi:hypothetical protein